MLNGDSLATVLSIDLFDKEFKPRSTDSEADALTTNTAMIQIISLLSINSKIYSGLSDVKRRNRQVQN